jgi:hypothetical protein
MRCRVSISTSKSRVSENVQLPISYKNSTYIHSWCKLTKQILGANDN